MKQFILSLILLVCLSSCKMATIRPLDPETGKAIISAEEQGFDAERYVESLWQEPLLTTVEEEAVNLPDLQAAIEADGVAASEQYGHQEGNSPYSFIVTGEGEVLEHDTSSRAGLLTLDLAPTDGEADINLAVGPVISGTALRDAMPFISFNDFTNQLEYADVSKALHERVTSEVLEPFDADASVGKTLRFWGASNLTEPIVITPVRLEVGE